MQNQVGYNIAHAATVEVRKHRLNLTISLPDTEVRALEVKATAQGMTAEQYALQVLERDLAPDWLRKSWSSAEEAGLGPIQFT